MSGIKCLRCGACCTAPDITSLNKPVGVRCSYLDDSLHCSIYGERPEVCRSYLPDEICGMISAETLAQRVENYLMLFGLR